MTPMTERNYDLHCHSNRSDGILAPAEVAARAHANGVDVLALTDHDEVSGVAEVMQAGQSLGLHVVPGVEISVTFAGVTVHIVGLNFDPTNADLLAGLTATRLGRTSRAVEMGKRLESMGMPGAYEGALQFVSNPQMIGRTHFARYLVQAGFCPDVQTVFTKYLGDDRAGQVAVQWATLEQAVSWINGAGGQAVIAHPGRYKFRPNQFSALFDTFIELGGVGIEVTTGSHTSDEARRYADVARRYGFLASRGSDFHSPTESRIDLGRLPFLPSDLKPVWHDWEDRRPR